MSFYRNTFVCAALTMLAACSEDRRPIGATCTETAECSSGECLAGYCLDPNEDSDSDGLLNKIEAALGTDPTKADTDGDGVNDGDEIGNEVQTPLDADHDGHIDAVESNIVDSDSDCIVNQLDPDDAVPETDPHELARFVCKHEGACVAEGASVTASCIASATPGKKTATCDYSGVPGYEATETSCNGKDDDCNGKTDERFGSDGEVTFTDVDATTKVLGDSCGTGACASGTVVCGDAATLACSSAAQVATELCNAIDDDCDGQTDEDFKAGGTHTFDGGPNAGDAGKVLGDACGVGACAGGTVVCASDDNTKLTCSGLSHAGPKACHSDANCDGSEDVAGENETLVGCTNHWHDDDGDGYGYGDPVCLCDANVAYPADANGDCDEKNGNVHPGALPLCGVDADCDDSLVDTMEVCDDGNEAVWDGCFECKISELLVTKLGNGATPLIADEAAGGFGTQWDLGWDGDFYQGREYHFYDLTGRETAQYSGFGADTYNLSQLWFFGLRGGGYLELSQMGADGYDELYAQSFTADGTRVGDPIFIADSTGGSDFYSARAAGLDGHRAVFAFTRSIIEDVGSGYRIAGAYIGEDGKPEDGGFEFDPGGSPFGLRLLGQDDGSLIVAYGLTNLQTYDQNFYVVRIGKDKSVLGKPAPAHGEPELQQDGVALVRQPGGRTAVFYVQQDPVPPESTVPVLYEQLLDAEGNLDGDKQEIATLTDLYIYGLGATANRAGDAIVYGSAEQSVGPAPVWLVPATGGAGVPLEVLNPEYLSSPGGPSAIALTTDEFIFAFHAYAGEVGGGGFLTRFKPDGTRIPVFPGGLPR